MQSVVKTIKIINENDGNEKQISKKILALLLFFVFFANFIIASSNPRAKDALITPINRMTVAKMSRGFAINAAKKEISITITGERTVKRVVNSNIINVKKMKFSVDIRFVPNTLFR